jgi:hypothetical protein
VNLVSAWILHSAAEENLNRLKQIEPSHEKLAELQQMVADVKAGKEVKLPEH